ncbi:ABC transporter permease [Enterococcus sp. CSURQ0835]|uniref:ABC transporter permease n=1 Tax=Enterococcus sp. CSURQ0835 TaxID=2681394 RepID=UPI001F310ED1|nr:FtsX-like permease family protein [Enterococcus sp. CSURQ0835]
MENEAKLRTAQTTLDNLSQPNYSVMTRRETPGSEGYKVYANISQIVDALASVFPIFLFFVAALVTFTTMGRFVDEERTNSGTLKALGYRDQDILKKFTVYGLTSSLAGAILGILLGHLVLPLVVYNAYNADFDVPPIELRFHWKISVLALILAFISAVIPAFIAAKKNYVSNQLRSFYQKHQLPVRKSF